MIPLDSKEFGIVMRNCVSVRAAMNDFASGAIPIAMPAPYIPPEPFTWKKYEVENGAYRSEDGCDYEDFRQFVLEDIFGFCGCGALYKATEFIRDGLRHVLDRRNALDGVKGGADSKEWKDACRRDSEEEQRVFGSGGAAMFFYYVLDTKDLTDHGGSVPGWLNDRGHALLDELTEFLENEE